MIIIIIDHYYCYHYHYHYYCYSVPSERGLSESSGLAGGLAALCLWAFACARIAEYHEDPDLSCEGSQARFSGARGAPFFQGRSLRFWFSPPRPFSCAAAVRVLES